MRPPFIDPELAKLLEKAKAAYDAQTPEEKWKHRREQLISWTYGEMQLRGRELSRQEVEAIVDRMIAKGELPHCLADGHKPVGKSVYELIMSDEDFP